MKNTKPNKIETRKIRRIISAETVILFCIAFIAIMRQRNPVNDWQCCIIPALTGLASAPIQLALLIIGLKAKKDKTLLIVCIISTLMLIVNLVFLIKSIICTNG